MEGRITHVQDYLEEFRRTVQGTVNEWFEAHSALHAREKAEAEAAAALAAATPKEKEEDEEMADADAIAEEKNAIQRNLEDRVENVEEALEALREQRKETQTPDNKLEELIEAKFGELSIKHSTVTEDLGKQAALISSVRDEQMTANAALMARLDHVEKQLSETLARIGKLEEENQSLKQSLEDVGSLGSTLR